MAADQKRVEPILIPPPPESQRVSRGATFAADGESRNRYHLPTDLETSSPVGYRTRVSFTRDEAAEVLSLLSLGRPSAFTPEPAPIREQELFESTSLGILSSRQSTNYRGHRQVSLGPADAPAVAALLRRLDPEAPVLDHAAALHVVLSRPYRTPFTMLLTLVGHMPVLSLLTVPHRIYRKKVHHEDDIPTILYLQHLHVGILADAFDRAVIVSSAGRRRAQVFMRPFSEPDASQKPVIRALEGLIGLTGRERREGWRVALVVQEGEVADVERPDVRPGTLRKLGANLLALRSERIQPGVNNEDKAPAAYQERQDMDVPEALVEQAGRALFNAFVHWTDIDRERAKELVLLERVDVLTPNGKQRLREIRRHLGEVTDQVVKRIPLWVDLPTGLSFRKNAARGKKAFALAGQRIYIGGLSKPEVQSEGLGWLHAIRATGAAAARSALVAEILGATEVPEGCDLLGGICLMAGPVNQNDVGKAFFGHKDLLAGAYPERDPTSLLVWTLKAKTVADPVGNEQQLMDAKRKGALVDLRPGPHEVVEVRREGISSPLRGGAATNTERAFHEIGNFVVDPEGKEIPGNRGEAWPAELSGANVW